jgi:hypothetical protein
LTHEQLAKSRTGAIFCFTSDVPEVQNSVYAMTSVGVKGNHESPTHPTPVSEHSQCNPE